MTRDSKSKGDKCAGREIYFFLELFRIGLDVSEEHYSSTQNKSQSCYLCNILRGLKTDVEYNQGEKDVTSWYFYRLSVQTPLVMIRKSGYNLLPLKDRDEGDETKRGTPR